jgi:hypothetical protein
MWATNSKCNAAHRTKKQIRNGTDFHHAPRRNNYAIKNKWRWMMIVNDDEFEVF